MLLNATTDRARGYMLLGIIYLHSLIAFASAREPEAIMASFVQIKLLSPHVSVFFLLSGIGARHIARRRFAHIARQSAALILLATFSHLTGVLLATALHGPGGGFDEWLRMLVEPVVLGTGYSTFVAWFFVSLAMARLFTFLLYRDRRLFALVAAAIAAALFAGWRLGLPDNLFEWRTWPSAILFFLIGTRIPPDLAIKRIYAVIAGLGTLALAWFNRPGLLFEGPCLACDVTFVSQPMVGQYGSIPVLMVQELLFLAFLLALARGSRPRALTRLPAFVGKYSAQFLLLNGWVMVALYPWLLPLLPAGDSPLLFLAIFAGGTALHVGLFRLLKRPLNLMLLKSFQTVDLVRDLGARFAGRGRASDRPSVE